MNTRKPQAQPKKKSEEKAVLEEVAEVETVVEEWEEVQIDDLVNELESMRAAMYQMEAKNAQVASGLIHW
jgi:DNA-binding protein H-NS